MFALRTIPLSELQSHRPPMTSREYVQLVQLALESHYKHPVGQGSQEKVAVR